MHNVVCTTVLISFSLTLLIIRNAAAFLTFTELVYNVVVLEHIDAISTPSRDGTTLTITFSDSNAFSYASRRQVTKNWVGMALKDFDVVEFGAGDHNLTKIIAKLEEVKAGTSRIGTEGI